MVEADFMKVDKFHLVGFNFSFPTERWENTVILHFKLARSEGTAGNPLQPNYIHQLKLCAFIREHQHLIHKEELMRNLKRNGIPRINAVLERFSGINDLPENLQHAGKLFSGFVYWPRGRKRGFLLSTHQMWKILRLGLENGMPCDLEVRYVLVDTAVFQIGKSGISRWEFPLRY